MHEQTRNGKRAGFRLKHVLALLLAVVMLVSPMATVTVHGEETLTTGTSGDFQRTYKEGSYMKYRYDLHGDAVSYSGAPIVIQGGDYKETNLTKTGVLTVFANYEGKQNVVLIPAATEEQMEQDKLVSGGLQSEYIRYEAGYVIYEVTVPETGLYEVYLNYMAADGTSTAIERELWIDGELPFIESSYLNFSRVWTTDEELGSVKDGAGNELMPDTVEVRTWRTEPCNDNASYSFDPFQYYLTAGTHELKFISAKEPMMLAEVILTAVTELPSYESVKAEYAEKGYTVADITEPIRIEAENTTTTSETALRPNHNRSSANTTGVTGAFTYKHTQLNVIGGDRWRNPGQWMTWDITVPVSGLYNITIRGRQNSYTDQFSSRCLTINGEIPFAEAKTCKFAYSGDFTYYVLGEAETGEAFQFYFEAGKTYSIGLEATMGSAEALVARIDSAVNILTDVYRTFLMLIGGTPDVDRDYNFDEVFPEEIEILKQQAQELYDIADQMQEMTGMRSSNVTMLENTAKRLLKMANRTILIAENFSGFKSDITSMGNFIYNMNSQPLQMDSIYISPSKKSLPRCEPSFFVGIAHEIKLFYYSFVVDYTVVGSEATQAADPLTVWFSGGREQAQILKTLIEDDFSLKYPDIPVNMRISATALLQAALAGIAPDVSMSGASIDLAMRGALVNLKELEGYDEVEKRFVPAAMTGLTYQGGVYGLPNTVDFEVMVYRTDVLEDLGLAIPQTWNDVYDMLPELQNNNLNFGMPAINNRWLTFMYQSGVELYRGEGNDVGYMTNLDSEGAIDAFINYVELYRSYQIDLTISFLNRFRTGEAPLGITGFNFICDLNITAPELRGLWDVTMIPGTEREDENGQTYIDRTNVITPAGCCIMSKSEHIPEAWEFIKWWSSDEIQMDYCLNVESVLGISERISSANASVMEQQAWGAKILSMLLVARTWTKGTPVVPGDYYNTRAMTNAFTRAYADKTDARETLLDYIDEINEELTRKREEMGLAPVDPSKYQ